MLSREKSSRWFLGSLGVCVPLGENVSRDALSRLRFF